MRGIDTVLQTSELQNESFESVIMVARSEEPSTEAALCRIYNELLAKIQQDTRGGPNARIGHAKKD